MKVFVETAAKKVFVGATEWPGLARSGRTEEEALARLLEYVARYKGSLGQAAGSLAVPHGPAGVEVTARLDGGSGTDFGVPSTIGDFDRVTPSEGELARQIELLHAAWAAFDAAADGAEGAALATGPRGGGRDLPKLREHVLDADRAYISSLGAKAPPSGAAWRDLQQAFIEALHAKLRGELPERGPRGGERWPTLYAVRRSAWHALDHAWEIEDRLS